MKVTVKDNYLNVRVGQPRVNAPCYQYLAPGSELEVDGEFYKGDLHGTIDKWLKDEAGNYYWSGGVDIPISGNNVNYNKTISQIPNSYTSTEGKGIKVAVLDSGFDILHPSLDKRITDSYNSKDGSKNVINDNYHGTFITAILGGISKDGNGIVGVAPKSEIYVSKIQHDGIINATDVIKGLSWAINIIKVNVINMSFDLRKDDFENNKQTIIDLVDTAHNNGIIVICQGGNNLDVLSKYAHTKTGFTKLTNVIYVGAIDKNFLNQYNKDEINHQVQFLSPLTKYTSASNDISKYSSDIGVVFLQLFFLVCRLCYCQEE